MDTRTVRQHASLSDVAQDVASQRDNGIAPHDAANYALAQIGRDGVQWPGRSRSPEDIAAGLRQAARESEQGGAPTLSQHGPAYLRAVARMIEQGPSKIVAEDAEQQQCDRCGNWLPSCWWDTEANHECVHACLVSDVRHAQARRGGEV